MMGHWSDGILKTRVWRNEICFYMDGSDQKIKSDDYPLFDPQYSIFLSDSEALRAGGHHSIIPWII
jgi:hypothetical protein